MRSLLLLLTILISLSQVSADEKKNNPGPTLPPTVLPKEDKKLPEEKTTPKVAPVKAKTFQDHVTLEPIFKGTTDTGKCLYTYNETCFTTLAALEAHLLKQMLVREIPGSLEKKLRKTLDVDESGKPVTRTVINFQNKNFMTEEDYLLYMIETLQAKELEKKTGQAPAPNPLSPKPTDELTIEKRPADRVVGKINYPHPGYIVLGTYTQLGPKGPVLLSGLNHEDLQVDRRFEEFEENFAYEPVQLCFLRKELRNLIPQDQMIEYERGIVSLEKKEVTDETFARTLPTLINGKVKSNTAKLDKESLCYDVQIGRYLVSEKNAGPLNDYYRKPFRDVPPVLDQVEALAKHMKEKTKGKTISVKEQLDVAQDFWRNEVKYLLDDHALYNEYFRKNPNSNMVAAACDLKQGRCVPKNFGLGVTVQQHLGGDVYVRFTKGFNLERTKEKSQEINTKSLHLGIEVLLPVEKGVYAWVPLEASVSEAAQKEAQALEKTNREIREVVKKELGETKQLQITLVMKTDVEIASEVTARPRKEGQKENDKEKTTLTSMVVKNRAMPEIQTGILSLKPNGENLELSGLISGIFPKTSLLDIPAGKPEHLLAFMDVAEYDNEITFGRSWKSLGNKRHEDTRVVNIFLPNGKMVEIRQVFTFNFGTPEVIEKVEHYVDGKLAVTVTATVKK